MEGCPPFKMNTRCESGATGCPQGFYSELHSQGKCSLTTAVRKYRGELEWQWGGHLHSDFLSRIANASVKVLSHCWRTNPPHSSAADVRRQDALQHLTSPPLPPPPHQAALHIPTSSLTVSPSCSISFSSTTPLSPPLHLPKVPLQGAYSLLHPSTLTGLLQPLPSLRDGYTAVSCHTHVLNMVLLHYWWVPLQRSCGNANLLCPGSWSSTDPPPEG